MQASICTSSNNSILANGTPLNKDSITELTEKTTKTFHDDCKYLNCEKPTHEPKATENIELMITKQIIQTLLPSEGLK